MESRPISLGETAAKKLKLIRHTVPLPGDRAGIIAKFAELINLGLVQKILVQVGDDIIIERFVDSEAVIDGTLPILTELEDLMAEIRNGEMIELEELDRPTEGLNQLFHAFKHFDADGFKPTAIIIPRYDIFAKWVDINDEDYGVDTVLGYPVYESKELTDDTVLVTGTSPTGTFTVRLTMEFKKEKKK